MYCKWCGNKIDSFTECCIKCGRAAYLPSPRRVPIPSINWDIKILIGGVLAFGFFWFDIIRSFYYNELPVSYLVIFACIQTIRDYKNQKDKPYTKKAKWGRWLALITLWLLAVYYMITLDFFNLYVF